MAHMPFLFLWKAFLKVLMAHYFLKSEAFRQSLLKLNLTTTKSHIKAFCTNTYSHTTETKVSQNNTYLLIFSIRI